MVAVRSLSNAFPACRDTSLSLHPANWDDPRCSSCTCFVPTPPFPGRKDGRIQKSRLRSRQREKKIKGCSATRRSVRQPRSKSGRKHGCPKIVGSGQKHIVEQANWASGPVRAHGNNPIGKRATSSKDQPFVRHRDSGPTQESTWHLPGQPDLATWEDSSRPSSANSTTEISQCPSLRLPDSSLRRALFSRPDGRTQLKRAAAQGSAGAAGCAKQRAGALFLPGQAALEIPCSRSPAFASPPSPREITLHAPGRPTRSAGSVSYPTVSRHRTPLAFPGGLPGFVAWPTHTHTHTHGERETSRRIIGVLSTRPHEPASHRTPAVALGFLASFFLGVPGYLGWTLPWKVALEVTCILSHCPAPWTV